MQQQEPINTPLLDGWAIACGAGAVAFGVSFVVVGIDGNGSVAIGAVVALVVGLIMGLPLRRLPPPNTVNAPGASASSAPAASAPAPAASAPAPAASAPAPAASAAAASSAKASAATAGAAPAAAAQAETAEEGTRPPALDAARGGTADDLKKIKGVGPKLEAMLNAHGIYHFDQIAAWSTDELAWVDSNLEGFYGRASRDEWVPQARILAGGGETEFSSRQE